MRTSIAGGLAAAVLFAAALSACATLNEDECQAADWVDLGYSDGAAGRSPSHLDRHREACARHDLPVEAPQWRDGWEEGIRRYCTPENGLREGRAGRSYAGSCPAEVATDFERAYDVGHRVHEARDERDRIRREIDMLLDDMDEAEKRKERGDIRRRISYKRSDLFAAEDRLRDAEYAHDRYALRHGM